MKTLSNSFITFYVGLLSILTLLMLQSCSTSGLNLFSSKEYSEQQYPGQSRDVYAGVIKSRTLVTVDTNEVSGGEVLAGGIIGAVGGGLAGRAVAGKEGAQVGAVAGGATGAIVAANAANAKKTKQYAFQYIIKLSLSKNSYKKGNTDLISVVQSVDNEFEIGDKVYVITTNYQDNQITRLVRRND